MALKVRKGDTVKVISGKDVGRTGEVIRVEPKKERVFVEGLNMRKRHKRATSIRDTQRGGEVGGIIEAEGPIHVSNVMLLDPTSGDPTRVGSRRDENGRRVRVARRSGEAID